MQPSEQLLNFIFQRIKNIVLFELSAYDIKIFPDITTHHSAIKTKIFIENGITITWNIEIVEWIEGRYTLSDLFIIRSSDVLVNTNIEVDKYITSLKVCRMLIGRIQDSELYEMIEKWRGY